MATYFVNNASCWKRLISTDNYESTAEWYTTRQNNIDPDSFLRSQIGKFKHEFFAFALQKSPYENGDAKSIYLYVSGFRYIKAWFEDKMICIEFRNDNTANLFRDSFEKLANGRWPMLKTDFFAVYKQSQYINAGYYYWGYYKYFKKKRLRKRKELIVEKVDNTHIEGQIIPTMYTGVI